MATINASINNLKKAVMRDCVENIKKVLGDKQLLTEDIIEALNSVSLEEKQKKKRSTSGYHLFLKEYRPTFLENEDNQGLSPKEIMIGMAKVWKTLSADEKLVYNERAKSSDEEKSEPETPKVKKTAKAKAPKKGKKVQSDEDSN
jgi:hypothetical protein